MMMVMVMVMTKSDTGTRCVTQDGFTFVIILKALTNFGCDLLPSVFLLLIATTTTSSVVVPERSPATANSNGLELFR